MLARGNPGLMARGNPGLMAGARCWLVLRGMGHPGIVPSIPGSMLYSQSPSLGTSLDSP